MAEVLCRFDDLTDPGAKAVMVDGRSVIVVRRGAMVYGWINSCPHVGVELNLEPDQFFDFTGRYLMCGYHGAIFTPTTGLCVRGPCKGQSLSPFPLAVVEGAVVMDPTHFP